MIDLEKYIWMYGYKVLNNNYNDGVYSFIDIHNGAEFGGENNEITFYKDIYLAIKRHSLGTKYHNSFYKVKALVREKDIKKYNTLTTKKIIFLERIDNLELIKYFQIDEELENAIKHPTQEDKMQYYYNFDLKDVYVNKLENLGYSNSFSKLLVDKSDVYFEEQNDMKLWNTIIIEKVYTLAKALYDEKVSKDLRTYLLLKEVDEKLKYYN